MKHCIAFVILLLHFYHGNTESEFDFLRKLHPCSKALTEKAQRLSAKSSRSNRTDQVASDTPHYWRLKPFFNPQEEGVRINPDNYEDRGVINPITKDCPCNTGYVELCGIYVHPDPANKSRPHFSERVNSDVYEALKKNQFLEGKVFFKDL